MPRLLVERFADDSINQFRMAAYIRNQDAQQLNVAAHHAAAVYLWGYVAEMTLKAAWFQLIGFRPDQPITVRDMHSARGLAGQYGISWPGNLHALDAWARLLVEHRIRLGSGYSPRFCNEVLVHSRRVYARWRETLRYKKNRAYPAEARTVAQSAQWLLYHSDRL
jgi:hypothetical protein